MNLPNKITGNKLGYYEILFYICIDNNQNNNIMYTPQALIEQQLIKINFPTLWRHYQDEMGNFVFTALEFRQNIRAITRWMQEFNDYRIVIEESYFYLTNI